MRQSMTQLSTIKNRRRREEYSFWGGGLVKGYYRQYLIQSERLTYFTSNSRKKKSKKKKYPSYIPLRTENEGMRDINVGDLCRCYCEAIRGSDDRRQSRLQMPSKKSYK
ncbi:hypothetical protein YC2023_061243 [Brassica napus]